ncbi:cytochrome d ubiquinol oxidase subunit II [Pseudonocardiaceae bacterium YIM PH 21723]|nr:cytochrome d ubiquinol oxidase subunit II [Pseudonocardiaceae bacterium YIM PH 21723]
MDLPVVWFCLIAFLWLGYLFLEGFDFGVGMLVGLLARDNDERRVLINTIGPVWDGNEVWMIVAVGATFAAFPNWYASLLSGSYLYVLAILLALIVRGVAFEYRGKVDSLRWRRWWDRAIAVGSWVPPFAWGVVLTATVTGLPLDRRGDLVGGPLELIRWDTLLGGVALVGFSLVHGAVFVALKSAGDIQRRARQFAATIIPVALAPVLGLVWVLASRSGRGVVFALAGMVIVAAALAMQRLWTGRPATAFALLGAVIAGTVAVMFGGAYPNVLPSTLDSAYSLTVWNAAASSYPLQVITWVAAFGAPAVLIYQGWTYWVFRKRIGTQHLPPVHVP